MTQGMVTQALVAGIVNDLFADLRQRKFLSYLFDEDPDARGAYGYIERPLDLGVQAEIADEWSAIVELHLAALNAAPVAEGFVMVPKVPTEAMREAWIAATRGLVPFSQQRWAAMLKAAAPATMGGRE